MTPPEFKICFKGATQHEFVLAEQGKEYRIGRAADNDIVVENPLISRYHLTILWDWNDAIVVSDLDSVNGITVNGARIKDRTVIDPSDTVMLGDLDFIRVVPDAPVTPTTVPSSRDDAQPLFSSTKLYTAFLISGIILVLSAVALIVVMLM